MSIRVKLILTYALLVLISVFVLVFSGVAIVSTLAAKTVDAVLEEDDLGVVMTDLIDLLAELKQADIYDEDKLIRPEYIEAISNRTDFYSGGLVVKYKDQILSYDSLPKTPEFYELLVKSPDYFGRDSGGQSIEAPAEEKPHHNQMINYNNRHYFYVDYVFDVKGQEVLYFFIIDTTKVKGFSSETRGLFFKVILAILLIIMTPLIVILTNDIIKPLRKLEEGVHQIKEGNLDFELKTKSKNEIGRVITTFDRMRSELKLAIDKQVGIEENRKELISSITHDLKTPITAIKGHVEGILDGVADTPEKLQKYLRIIHRKSVDMDRLIDDLFLFSKLDLNRLPFEMKSVDLGPFLLDIVSDLKMEWESDHQTITVNLPKENMPVMMDLLQMRRVIMNILQNGIKYMDKEIKHLDMTVVNFESEVQIRISDNGIGIDASHLEHVFDRFYRVDQSRNLETGGTGLGLAIAKQIVKQHHGQLVATSVLGEGTTMIITLNKNPLVNLDKPDKPDKPVKLDK